MGGTREGVGGWEEGRSGGWEEGRSGWVGGGKEWIGKWMGGMREGVTMNEKEGKG